MSELLDKNESFGTRHQFIFGNDTLTIRERKLFGSKTVNEILIAEIKEINYLKPKISFIAIILSILFLPIMFIFEIAAFGPVFQKSLVQIKYNVGGELALVNYISRVTKKDLQEMRTKLKNN